MTSVMVGGKMNDNIATTHTVVVIAHRLSTALNAHKVIVLEDGKLVGAGNHEELMHSCLEYKALWEAYKSN